jgi:FeS assembly SUF system protein
MSNEAMASMAAPAAVTTAAPPAPPAAEAAMQTGDAAVAAAGPEGPGGPDAALSPEETTRLTDDIVAALKSVYDPEIPADVYELGLIYRIEIGDNRAVAIDMTLTTPNCPSAQELPGMVENAAASVPGVGPVNVNIVWDPPWEPSRMSDEARMVLNMW